MLTMNLSLLVTRCTIKVALFVYMMKQYCIENLVLYRFFGKLPDNYIIE